jgi:hypothetical protein
MAACGADAHQRATRRTNLGTRLFVSATEETTDRVLPPFDAILPLIGKRQQSSLRQLVGRSYNTEIAPGLLRMDTTMDKFEEIGRRIDEELARLRSYVEEEVAPETERRTASFLREVSGKLTEVAAKLEARMAARRPPPTQNPRS